MLQIDQPAKYILQTVLCKALVRLAGIAENRTQARIASAARPGFCGLESGEQRGALFRHLPEFSADWPGGDRPAQHAAAPG